jgi:hypothetical protein
MIIINSTISSTISSTINTIITNNNSINAQSYIVPIVVLSFMVCCFSCCCCYLECKKSSILI